MPTYKVLAQSAPSAATATTLYTASNAVIVSTLNMASITNHFRMQLGYTM